MSTLHSRPAAGFAHGLLTVGLSGCRGGAFGGGSGGRTCGAGVGTPRGDGDQLEVGAVVVRIGSVRAPGEKNVIEYVDGS